MAVIGVATIALVAGEDEADGGLPKSGRWTNLPSSPLSRTEVGAARIGSSIYVVGGFVAPNLDTIDQAARYDIDSRHWSAIAPMPLGVNHPAVAASGGQVYVYGGYAASGSLSGETDALQRFDPATGAWTRLAGSGIPRGAATLAAVGGRLFAIGGTRGGTPT